MDFALSQYPIFLLVIFFGVNYEEVEIAPQKGLIYQIIISIVKKYKININPIVFDTIT